MSNLTSCAVPFPQATENFQRRGMTNLILLSLIILSSVCDEGIRRTRNRFTFITSLSIRDWDQEMTQPNSLLDNILERQMRWDQQDEEYIC